MKSHYDYKIILNKGKTKPKIFLFLTLNQALISLVTGIVVYKILELFVTEIFALIVGIGIAVAIASLFIEMPTDHLNVMQHLKLAYDYYFVIPHKYHYYRTKEEHQEEIELEKDEEIYEERYKAQKSNKKRKVLK